MAEAEQKLDAKRTRQVSGSVTSAKMDKTITVLVERQLQHPLYKKYVRRRTKMHAHDEQNACKEGDKVVIEECRPISKSKSWRLVEVVSRSD